MPASSARRSAPTPKGQAASNGRKASADHDGHQDGLKMPSLPSMSMPRVNVPGGMAGNVLWWGGLAAVAAFGVVDWPVVALVAAGTWVAEQHSKQSAGLKATR